MVWDSTTPAGTEGVSNGDNRIRELKTDIESALTSEGSFPGADTSNPKFRWTPSRGNTASRPASPVTGQLYLNTQTGSMERYSGGSWASELPIIPTGTAMVFYQASAPTGWTAVAVNDKFLRVVTSGGTGGTTGGTVAASTSLAHTHTVASHTHDMGNHTHSIPSLSLGSGSSFAHSVDHSIFFDGGTGLEAGTIGGAVNNRALALSSTATGTSGAPSSNVSGTATPSTDSQLGVFAYSDVIVATKD